MRFDRNSPISINSIDVATEQKIISLVKETLKYKTVITILIRLEAAMELI